ncbi:MAG: hypothetical protein BWX58_00359 [Deltaproteobacteria bacterium ADurb.Bin026]|nr:MAG: hypothetical protein BWX58_00359 [Deltaproteobacteria bacterium ADurb.Bin026]
MLYFFNNSFVNTLLVSIKAPFCLGPKIGIPDFSYASTIPDASGFSGPTTTSSIFSFFVNVIKPSMSEIFISTHVAISEIPPFPGIQKIVSTSFDSDSFHTSACSLPPPPITSTFIKISLCVF